jgi:hypothetical protein
MLAGWFDNAMQRMSGNYKRRQLLISLLLALLLAILFNIDSIPCSAPCGSSRQLAAHITDAPGALDPAVRQLTALPIGWTRVFRPC